MATKSKHSLNDLIPAQHPDELLLPTSTPAAAVPEQPMEAPGRIRFTNTIDPDIWRQLHRVAYWSRRDLNLVMEAALTQYFQGNPDAQQELPKDELKRRRLG